MSAINRLSDRLLDKLVKRGRAQAADAGPTACGPWFCVDCWCPGSATGCRECRTCNGVRTCQNGCNC